MTTEQREALDRLNKDKKCSLDFKGYITIVRVADLDTVSSLIKEQNKQIDLMAFNLADYVMYYDYDKCRNPEMIKNKAKEIKQYFERKVEDVES